MKEKIKQLNQRFVKWYDKQSLQTTIVFPFTIAGLCVILIMACALYLRFGNVAKGMVEEKNIQILDQTNQALNSYLKQMMKVSDTVYYEILKQKDTEDESIYGDLGLLYNANQDKVVSIALFDWDGQVVEAFPVSTVKKNVRPQKEDWYTNAANKIEELYFTTPHVQNIFDSTDAGYRWVVSLSRYVEFVRNGKVEEGVLLVDMNFGGIEQVLKSVELGNNSYLYLMDPYGEIIYHPKQQLLYTGIETEDTQRMKDYEDGTYTLRYGKERKMTTVKTVGYTGWKLVSVVPMEEVNAQYRGLQTYILIIAICLAFIFIELSSFITKKITDPIYRLEKAVGKLEAGEWNTEIKVSGSEEIRHLAHAVESMVNQLKQLMDDVVMEQELKRKSELDALQTQINPHFLYNTLDSVVWMIENEKYEGAVTMVTSLARLFRISISKGKSIISVREELAHAEYYMAIQNVRYKNKFTYSIEADDAIKEYATVKLILQPMIENAINHGMAYMDEDDGGHIIVRAYEKDGQLWMEVEDNGCGITKERMEDILSGRNQGKSPGSGIGMRNVHERIRIYYGNEYGVQMFSEPDEGTLIRMNMPLIPIKDVKEGEIKDENK